VSTRIQTAANPAVSLFSISADTSERTVETAASTVRKRSFIEQVEFLLATVGPRITAAGAGLRDARQLPAWRRGEEPREDVKLERVAALAEVTTAVLAEYPASVAASFLRGSQPALDDRSPMLMIRNASEHDFPEVMGEVRGALRAFLEG
jgi:hypothetical protein